MTFNSDIEKTEAEIKVLQAKLDLLKEIEAHKSQPKMNFELGGKFEIVSYNGENYYRYGYNDKSHGWYKRKHTGDGMMMVRITDGETRRLLEGLWFNQVKKGKYDEQPTNWEPTPQTPEEVAEGLRSAMMKAKEDGVFDEVEWDEKDTPNLQKIIDKMVEERKSKKLRNMLKVQLDYDGMVCDDIVDIVEEWILDEQSASGSQNVNTELLVEGFNDAIRKMKEMLR